MQTPYDFIIVGAGSAGCVLANRLSADPAHRVLLIEAGPRDWNPVFRVPIMAGRLYMGRYCNWGYETEPEPQLNGVRSGIPRPAKTKRPPRACRDYQHVYTMIGTGTVFLHVSVCRDAFSGTAVLADSAPKDGWDVCVQLRGHLTGPGPATYLSTLPMTSRNGNAHGFQNGPTVKFGPKTTKTEDSVTVNTGRCRGSGSKVQTSWQNQERLVTG